MTVQKPPKKEHMLTRIVSGLFGLGALATLVCSFSSFNLVMCFCVLFVAYLFLAAAFTGRLPKMFMQRTEENSSTVVQGANPLFILKGRQGKTVFVEGSNVKVTKKGGIFATQRDKTIPIRNITSVEVKKPGPVVVGFIQFSIAGGVARDSSYTYTGGAFGAVQDENSIIFADTGSYEVALQIKTYVETFGEPSAPSSQRHVSSAGDDPISKLERLAALKQNGVLTEDEFAHEKAKALGQQPGPGVPQHPTRPQVPEEPVAPCPLCQKNITLSRLRVGENQCPHCRGTFVAE